MYSFIALGDSYTIGEGVPLYESYPYQTVQILRRAGHDYFAPEIIARTGWTTGELAAAMDHTRFLAHYDIATLLIGVNNQYRGRSIEEYGVQFEMLLSRATHLASRVIVLSIPDWGVSPFAAAGDRDPGHISREIDAFNTVAAAITRRNAVPFIDITDHSRITPIFTTDGLHPGREIYAFWAQQLTAHITGPLPAAGQ